jgi:hypothetical protein
MIRAHAWGVGMSPVKGFFFDERAVIGCSSTVLNLSSARICEYYQRQITWKATDTKLEI